MSEVTARALIAGFVSGAATAFASTALLLVALTRSQARGRNWLPGWERVKPGLIGILFANLLMLIWTALGLVLGALYLRARSHYPGAGLASPNLTFTLGVLIAVAVVLGGVAFVRRGVAWPAWGIGLVALAAFGWMLPNLAR